MSVLIISLTVLFLDMLVYIRESDLNEVLCDVTMEDVPASLRRCFEKEQQQLAVMRSNREENSKMAHVKV